MTIQLIDVTLRESVHLENVLISVQSAQKVVEGLSKAEIDFIEIGYLAQKDGQNNLLEYSPSYYIDALADALAPDSESKLVLMLHPKSFHRDQLARMIHPAVGMVRLCIPLSKVNDAIPLIRELKENGIAVCANLMHASHASEHEMISFAKKVEEVGADYMYIADSNGALLPQQVSSLFAAIGDQTTISLGFHPHDNLHLASANTLAALRAGVEIIDGSIYGFGKGAGNLRIESFVACLKRMGIAKRWNLGHLITASRQAYEDFIGPVRRALFTDGEVGILTGYHDMNTELQHRLQNVAAQQGLSLLDLLIEKENESLSDLAS